MEIILILFPIILYLYLFFIHYKKIIEVYDASFIEKEKLFQEVETLELELKNIKRNTQQLLTNMMNLRIRDI